MILFLKQILTTALALLFLVVNTSFTVRTHYCGSKLVSVKLNQPAKKCCKFKVTKTANFVKPKKSCCHDFTFTNNADNDFIKKEISSKWKALKIIGASTIVYAKLLPFKLNYLLPPTAIDSYTPPLLSHDTNTLFQVFRI